MGFDNVCVGHHCVGKVAGERPRVTSLCQPPLLFCFLYQRLNKAPGKLSFTRGLSRCGDDVREKWTCLLRGRGYSFNLKLSAGGDKLSPGSCPAGV